MLHSVGIDIVEIDRFEKIVNRWAERFLKRILTPNELRLCREKTHAMQSMAARFAAKEAFIKCISQDGLPFFNWHEIEILSSENGKPIVKLHGRLVNICKDKKLFVSLSHTDKSATAIFIIEK